MVKGSDYLRKGKSKMHLCFTITNRQVGSVGTIWNVYWATLGSSSQQLVRWMSFWLNLIFS